MAKVYYQGIFFSSESVASVAEQVRKQFGEKVLFRTIPTPHVTTSFRPQPEEVDPADYGLKAQFTVVGYANDGKNEGLKVVLSDDVSDVLKRAVGTVRQPHVTVSVSRDGKPVDTGFMTFQPCEPVLITGTYGAYLEGGEVATSAQALA